ncbi:MAG TPA: hypothetical protein VHA37_01805 [Candidatus Saccharimonadales bacterium]|nr:hypothetical protein [Candidatus Saccharimonadales bacterium]
MSGECFTAKLVYEQDGVQRERLMDTDQVHAAWDARTPGQKDLEPMKLGVYDIPRSGGIVVLGNYLEGAESMAFTFGTIYIMNRDGKTVSKYHLSK